MRRLVILGNRNGVADRRGESGACGAGPLCGWSEHGTRPVFQLVAHGGITLAARTFRIWCATIIADRTGLPAAAAPELSLLQPLHPL